MNGKADIYQVTLECSETNEIETNKIFLTIRDYNKISNRINEIVYIDDNKKQWALKKIEKV